LTTFGVPEAFAGEDMQEALDLYCLAKGRGKKLIIPSKLLSKLPVLLNSWSK
jgi:hypothetical protein